MSDQDKCMQEFEKFLAEYEKTNFMNVMIGQGLKDGFKAAWKARDAEIVKLIAVNGLFRKNIDVFSKSQVELFGLIKQLETQLSEARTVIEFYGNETNWMQIIDGRYNLGKIWVECEVESMSSITTENGKRARAWLNKDNKNDQNK